MSVEIQRIVILVKLNVLLMSWPEFTEPSLPSLVVCGVVEWTGVSLYAVTLFYYIILPQSSVLLGTAGTN